MECTMTSGQSGRGVQGRARVIRGCPVKERRRKGGEERKTIRKRERTRQNLLGQGLGTEARG